MANSGKIYQPETKSPRNWQVASVSFGPCNLQTLLCCFAVSQLLIFGKSIISTANKAKNEDGDEQSVNIEWPEDVVEKAKMIRVNVQTMIGYVESVSNSFITG